MLASLFSRRQWEPHVKKLRWNRQTTLHVCALFLLSALIWLTFSPSPAQATPFSHTQATVNMSCQRVSFSTDGDPFPLCPGPAPKTGGNCVWWAWEQWHLLGYDLPLNWGNAADWIVDAERFGLPLGTQPRVGSLAVFPVADGVWAFGAAGHVAFVTAVSPDGQNFNVTYQNYGDPQPMHLGNGYNVPTINEPRFQRGQLRFVYFPKAIDPKLFAALPGVNGNDLTGIASANNLLDIGPNGTLASSRVNLGLAPGSYDQELSADFTGNGFTDLLLYNRQQGSLDVLALDYPYQQFSPGLLHNYPITQKQLEAVHRVGLSDSHTSVTGWGQNLEIHLGDYTGSGHTEILLYDRVSGQIQILTLTPQLTIAKHVTLPGWGPGWELYTGQFDGQHTDLFFYKRFAVPTPLPTPNTQPTDTPTPTDTSTPTPTPTNTSTPTPTPTGTATPTPTPTGTATPTPTPTGTTTPTPTPTATPTSTPTSTGTAGSNSTLDAAPFSGSPAAQLDAYQQNTTGTGEPTDPNGQDPAGWDTSGLSAKMLLVSLNADFTVGMTQSYSLWHNSWEIYIGRFVSPTQDGIFLYDRNAGEGRLVEYSSKLQLAQFQFIHNLGGNWDVHTGDFSGQGQAQILLYDPSSGDAQMMVLKQDLSIANQVSFSNWSTNQVIYVGHFGMPTLSLMLYDPQQSQSTFIAFDSDLNIAHQLTVTSWSQASQILVGSFLDRAVCLEQRTCATGDDVLVLDRSSGMVQQYVFSFGNQFAVYDNRIQGYLRDGTASTVSVFPIDASLFSLLSSQESTIHDEELY